MSEESEGIVRNWREDFTLQKRQESESSKIVESWRQGTEASAAKFMQSNLEPGVYAPDGLRWSLARGDNMEEKLLRLRKRYPTGELDLLPKSSVLGFDDDALIWRESPQAQWKFVEPQGFDKFDIPEAMAGSAEAAIGGTAAAFATGGMSIPATAATIALGAVAGESVEQAGQSITGVQAQSSGQILGEVGKEGALNYAGALAMSPLNFAYNAMRGAGGLRVGEEGLATLRAAHELSPEMASKMTPALVSDNPAIQLSEKQSAVILPGLNRRYRELISLLDNAVKSAAPGNASEASTEVAKGMQEFSDYFLGQIKTLGTKASEGGAAFKTGVEEYAKASKITVDELYKVARNIEEPTFDLKPVMDLASDLRVGSKGQLDPAIDAQIKRLENIDGPIQLSDGSILSVTDQIRNVRSKLWDLKQVESGAKPTQETGQANDLYMAITDVLNNPENANPLFKKAWTAANKASSIRAATLEQAPIVAAGRSTAPSELVRTYLRPHNSENLLAIRNTLPPNRWAEFVDAGYGELLSDPAKLSGKLAAFDQETLDAFMPRTEQELFKRVGRELDRIYSVGADTILETQIKNRNFIDTLIGSSNPRDAHTVIRAINNTNNKSMRDSFRAAIVEWSWDGVVQPTKDGLKIVEPLLKKRVADLKRSGMWSVLSSEERNIISNATIVSRAFQKVQDAGTSLLGAQAVSSVKKLQASGIMTFLRAGLLAEFYTSQLGRRILIGSGLPNSNAAFLRAFGGALAQMSYPEDISKLSEED